MKIVKEFEIDGVVYVARYKDNSFDFYIDTNKSESPLDYIDTNSVGFMMGDVPPDKVYASKGSKHAVKVAKTVSAFVEDVVANKKPYYFVYSANEERKVRLYRKVAEKISSCYNYYVVEEEKRNGKVFRFYKK